MKNVNYDHVEKKYDWESDIEFKYRIGTTKISKVIGICLKQINSIPNMKENENILKVVREVIDQLKKEKNSLKRLVVPGAFEKPNNYFLDCFNHYIKACELIIEGYVNVEDEAKYKTLVFKSTREFEAGNSNMNLTNYHLVNIVESKRVKYNDQSENL